MFRHGSKIGIRMALEDERVSRTAVRAPKLTTKRLLAAFPPSERNVDFRKYLPELDHVKIWEGARALADESSASSVYDRALNLSGWEDRRLLKPLRGISLAMGRSVTAVDLSDTAVNDADLQAFCARLHGLRDLKLVNCSNVSNLGVKFISKCSHRSLTRLSVSGCDRLTAEACGWISGMPLLGFDDYPACARLERLDLSRCTKMTDEAMLSLSIGCRRRLRFLSISGDKKVTDIGIVAIAKNCRQLEAIDLSDCSVVGDRTLRALGKCCHQLRSILAPRLGRPVKSTGVRALARGCPKLTVVNIAGAKNVEESALGELATGCPSLNTLNVTGCEQVTARTLRALIDGLGFVREAESFFGFVPIEQSASAILAEQQRDLEHSSARLISAVYRMYKARRAAKQHLNFLRKNRASSIISRCALRWQRRRRAARVKAETVKLACAGVLQRNWRAFRGRSFAFSLAEKRALLYSKQREIVCWQAAYRGYLCRKHDTHSVALALRRRQEMLFRRLQCRSATRIETAARAYLARRRVLAYAQLIARLRADAELAARHVQCCFRRFLATCELRRREFERVRRKELEAMAAGLIVGLFRFITSCNEAERLRRAARRLAVKQEKCAALIQRYTRGHFGRLEALRRRRIAARRMQAATDVQRCFRGSRILTWRHLRLNKVAASVFERQEFEVETSRQNATWRYDEFLENVGRDSCSEDEGESEWIERCDSASGEYSKTWFNAQTGEEVHRNPHIPDPVDAELVGCSVKIYWPRMEEWYKGTLAKFNKRRRRYRVEYYDGDHEWLDIEAASDRVQIFDGNSEWAMFNDAYRPQLELRRQAQIKLKELERKATLLEEESRHWEILEGGRWFNSLTGQTKFFDETSTFWMESRDENGFFCFENGETGVRVYADPRFREDANLEDAKEECTHSLHLGTYVLSALLDEHDDGIEDTGDDENKRRALIKLVEKSRKDIRNMSVAVTRARNLWPGDSFDENEHRIHAARVLRRATELLQQAEVHSVKEKVAKRDFIANMKRSATVLCRSCNHEVPQNVQYCVFCGERA